VNKAEQLSTEHLCCKVRGHGQVTACEKYAALGHRSASRNGTVGNIANILLLVYLGNMEKFTSRRQQHHIFWS